MTTSEAISHARALLARACYCRENLKPFDELTTNELSAIEKLVEETAITLFGPAKGEAGRQRGNIRPVGPRPASAEKGGRTRRKPYRSVTPRSAAAAGHLRRRPHLRM